MAIAMPSSAGPASTSAAAAISTSDSRLMTPVCRGRGSQQTATTGSPADGYDARLDQSYRKMSGRKKIEAVVSRS
jgi:hypothetical protein